MSTIRNTLASVAILLLAQALAPSVAAAAECEIDRPVVFANLTYDSARFHTAVAKYIVEKGYGCRVEDVTGDTLPLMRAVSRGGADIIMEIWTANPAREWVKAEAEGRTIRLGTSFPDAVEGWFVPTSLVSGPDAKAPDLKGVEDLARYRNLFADPDNPGMGRFYNCPIGWHCELVNTRKLAAYGLDAQFTNFRPETGEALTEAAETAAKSAEPILFYYWGPTWLLGKYQFTRLREPPFDAEIWEAMLNTEEPVAATANPVSKVVVGANTEFAAEVPALVEFLADYAADAELTSEALAHMHDHGDDPRAAAMYFLRGHEDVWAKWLPEDVASDVRASLDSE